MTRALVLGGAGFIGVAACKELMRRGVETIAAGRKERPYGTFTSYVAVDRADEEQLARALSQTQPDVVLDLACFHPQEVRAVARHFEGERYVLVSCEDAPTDLHDFPWTVVRPHAVFGPADPTLRIAAYIERVADGGPVLVPSETYQSQAGLAWVKDVGFACALACDLRKDTVHKAYDIGFDGVTLRGLIEGIALALGVPARLHPVPFADLPEGASPYGPDPSQPLAYVIEPARRELGFEPSALEDALAETLAWYRVAHPSHPGYATRARELAIAAAS